MGSRATRVAVLVSLLVPVLAAVRVWAPLLDNYFYGDDFLHLFDLTTRGTVAFLTQMWGGHLYLVRNAVFLGMVEAFGPEPRPFFWSVLVTHVVNVVLLHRVLRRLTGDLLLACTGAVLWGTCPALEGTLGWYSVYGQVLLTLVVLLLLGDLTNLSVSGGVLSTCRAFAWGMLVVIGGCCFGIGLGIAAMFPLVACLALSRGQRSVRALAVLVVTAAAVLGVYAVLRSSDLPSQRFMAPGVVLARMPAVLTMVMHLLGFGACALLGTFVGLDARYPDTVSVLAASCAAALVVGGGLASDGPGRRRLLALALLTVTAYGSVAAGRAPVLETFQVSLIRSAAWPRYHYLPVALLAIVLSVALAGLRDRGAAIGRIVHGAAVLWTAVRVTLVVTRPLAVDHHDPERAETATVLRNIREIVTATPRGGVAMVQNQPFASARLPALFPGWAGVFVIHFPGDVVDGRPVRFLVGEGDWRLAQQRGGRIAAIVLRR